MMKLLFIKICLSLFSYNNVNSIVDMDICAILEEFEVWLKISDFDSSLLCAVKERQEWWPQGTVRISPYQQTCRLQRLFNNGGSLGRKGGIFSKWNVMVSFNTEILEISVVLCQREATILDSMKSRSSFLAVACNLCGAT